MALVDNQRLYDIATRQQVYIEGVKVEFAREFNSVLLQLSIELNRLLSRVKYRTLDGLTKAELNKLITALRSSQSKIYNAYAQGIIKQLKDFMAADLEVNRRAYVYSKIEESEKTSIPSDEESIVYLQEENEQSNLFPLFGIASVTGNDDRLWSTITNAPIPANGLYLLPFIKTFTTSAQAGVENIIRKAWANGWTIHETLNELASEGNKQGISSQLQKIGMQANAVIKTAVQHVASIVKAGVMSSLYGWYTWHSVMDGKTTEICKSRNQKRYRFGAGPIPPAHINCRSHIAPSVGKDNVPDETFYTWVFRQPDDVQNDILGKEQADKMRSGNLKEKDLPKFEAKRPLTLEEFRKKIKEILSR